MLTAPMSTTKPSSLRYRYLPEILIVVAVLAYGAFFGFAWNGDQSATVQWWGGAAPTEQVPLFRIVLASFFAGLVVMAVLASIGRIERLLELHRLRKRMRELHEENARLRNVPESPRAPSSRTGA